MSLGAGCLRAEVYDMHIHGLQLLNWNNGFFIPVSRTKQQPPYVNLPLKVSKYAKFYKIYNAAKFRMIKEVTRLVFCLNECYNDFCFYYNYKDECFTGKKNYS